ncbi:MAG: serine/threonine protein kinase [Polyangiaceae bacterium]|nr:serine/threonine protein kinase [Polyangiaceae bacterium]
MPLAAGSTLKDTFVLERELGEGGMGVVWLARHRVLDSRVAVKVLHARCADDESARARFEQEARAIARVDSPHVVRIFDYGLTDEGEPFFVMELLAGRDLRAELDARGALGCADAVRIVRQACAALGRAHEAGITHRDIKPANIFLVAGSDELFVKLLDFGVAKLADHDLGMTQTHATVGTPYYMSPEQFVDPRTIDHRSDLWSLAVVAYACLVGRLPFLGESVGALSVAVHRGDFTPPCAANEALPGALDAWFARALAPERADRFQSARELAETFATAALAPVAAGDTSTTTRREPARRQTEGDGSSTGEPVVTEIARPIAAASAGPAAPTVAAGPPAHQAVLTAEQAPSSRPSAAAPPVARAPRRCGGAVLIGAVTAAALFAGLSAGLLMSRSGDGPAAPSAPAGSAAPAEPARAGDASPNGLGGPASTSASSASATATAGPSSASAAATAEPSSAVTPATSSSPSAPAPMVAPPPAPTGGPLPPPSATNLARGDRCAAPAQCASGFCADGVCCKTACTKPCTACTERKVFGRGSHAGDCGYIERGLDPDNECPGKEVCSGIGYCADPDKLPQW